MDNETFKSSAALATKLVSKEEGFRQKAYRNAPKEPWTVGFGFTFWPTGTPVKEGEEMTRLFAETFLEKQIEERLRVILLVTKGKITTANQAAALVSLHHNIGPTNFMKSTVLRQILKGNLTQAADAFLLWKRGNTADDLLPRRKRERALFLKPTTNGGATV